MTHSARLLAIALASASLGCSAIVDPEAADPLATAEGFCNSIQDALADLPCGASPAAIEQQYTYLRRHCDTLQAAVSAGRFTYSQGRAADCIDAIERYGCRGVFDAMAMTSFEWPQACQEALRGRVEAGGACTYREWSGAARQATDSWVLDECVDGAGCYPTPAGDGVCGETCAFPAALGESCYGDRPCQPGLLCAYNFGYVCQAGVTGDPCYSPSDCAGGYYGGSYCTGSPGTCQPAASVGSPCSLGAFCSADAYCASGTCVARAGPGQSCAGSVQCQLGLTCHYDGAYTCKYMAAEGESCAATSCDYTGELQLYCDAAKVCRRYPAEPLPRGADCYNLGTAYCADGLFCDSVGTFGPVSTCQPQLGPGADCSTGPGYEMCRPGTYCFYDSMASPPTSTCRDMPGVGGACDAMAMLPCEGGLACNAVYPATVGTCDTMPTDGEPCSSGGAMMGCAPGHYQDYLSTCVCRRYKGEGQPCANDTECGGSQTGLRCAPTSMTCRFQYACEVPIGWSPVGGP